MRVTGVMLLLVLTGSALFGAAARTRKGPRAIAVLEWDGDPSQPKARTSLLVPVTILDGGKYYDAGIYRASPVPMAIESGVVYDILKSGKLVGTFVTGASSHQEGQWYGLGSFKLHVEKNEPQLAKSSEIKVKTPDAVSGAQVYVPGSKKDKNPPPPPPRSDKNDKSPTDTSSSDSDPDRPHLRKGAPPSVIKESNDEEVARIDNDPNRPKLRRSTQEEQHESKSDPLAALKLPTLQSMVAVSDDYGAEPRSYAFAAKPEEQDAYRAAVTRMAAQELDKRLKNQKAANALQDTKLSVFDLNGNNSPVLVFTASGVQGRTKSFVTVVARVDPDQTVRRIFISSTDSDHLDVYPRLELVDAVDADGDGRGDLLFRAYSDAGMRYILYHAAPDSLEVLFDGAEAVNARK